MRRAIRSAAAVLCATAWLALAAAAAGAAATPDFTFQSSGKAQQPEAVAGAGSAGTYEDFPFTIAPGESDGAIAVAISWTNPANDFDLYVYRKQPDGKLQQVGSATGGAPETGESTVVQAADGPLAPGPYVIRVTNYASSDASFSGFAKFTAYVPPNQPPIAKLQLSGRAAPGQEVLLDASGSRDPDGRIVNYAWDVNGDGAMTTDTGATPMLRHVFSIGTHHVGVRVTDDRGARAYANATIIVTQPAPGPAGLHITTGRIRQHTRPRRPPRKPHRKAPKRRR